MDALEKIRLERAMIAADIRMKTTRMNGASSAVKEKHLVQEMEFLRRILKRRLRSWSKEMCLFAAGASLQIYMICYTDTPQKLNDEYLELRKKVCHKYFRST